MKQVQPHRSIDCSNDGLYACEKAMEQRATSKAVEVLVSNDWPRDNVLKPVPQPPSGTRTRIEGGLWNPKLDAVFLVAQTMSMRSIDPSRRWGSRGEEQPPWWGLGRSPRS